MATCPLTLRMDCMFSRPRIPAPMMPKVIVSFGEVLELRMAAPHATPAAAAPPTDRSMNSRREMYRLNISSSIGLINPWSPYYHAASWSLPLDWFSCCVIFPKRPIVMHETEWFTACRDFGERITVVADAAEQCEELPPGIELFPLRESGCGDPGALVVVGGAPRRRRPPQFVDVATAQPGFEQFEARFHRALNNVVVVRVPADAHARVVARLHDATNIGRSFRLLAVHL